MQLLYVAPEPQAVQVVGINDTSHEQWLDILKHRSGQKESNDFVLHRCWHGAATCPQSFSWGVWREVRMNKGLLVRGPSDRWNFVRVSP